MNEKFIKENFNCFASDLNDVEVLEVLKFIMSIVTISYSNQLTIIRQFLNNWLTVGVISEK